MEISKVFFEEVARYDKSSGICFYKNDRLSGRHSLGTSHILKKAGETIAYDNSGYYSISFNKNHYRIHRLIWIHFNGPIPEGYMIDHINRNRKDNRLENLRLATAKQNSANISKMQTKATTSHYLGVHWHARDMRWTARVGADKRHIGNFESEVEAAAAYNKAALALYGEYANLNVLPDHYAERPKTIKATSSNFRGVSWSVHNEKWRAMISIKKRPKHLGYYMTQVEAAAAYNAAATLYHGNLASLNVIPISIPYDHQASNNTKETCI